MPNYRVEVEAIRREVYSVVAKDEEHARRRVEKGDAFNPPLVSEVLTSEVVSVRLEGE